MKEIPLSQHGKNRGKYFALVDDEDFDYLNQWNWCIRKEKNTVYAARIDYSFEKAVVIRMHRLIKQTTNRMECDHIDGNGLNNQKINLRNCTHRQNNMNAKTNKNTSSIYKGVSYNKRWRSWYANIGVDYKQIWIGGFKTEIDAAQAYNEAAKKHFGEFARLNVIAA